MKKLRAYVRHLISEFSRARGIDSPLAVLVAVGALLSTAEQKSARAAA